MSITVKFFASLRERFQKSEQCMDLPAPVTVIEVWREATGEFQLPARVLIAVNMEYARPDYRVADGDEVAFFPPVSGG